ncbi:hypothetical protein E8E13_005289 [Curvularia kusanoi]|uniref:Heterokaryon incompatibility domain-containing protein n=1 Tax=Curvularia kusanoi TaxID=90978 RepID=A0A9P4TFM4_CURKU|nr:hypothetical protein E8E13_005289 [Curvularia kusanoi]
MGQIYEGAEKVLFWLGKATPQIIALMEELNQFRNTHSGGHYKPEAFKEWPWKDHSVAIKQLLKREWFTRVWILQEAAKARKADVCCGIHSIPSEIFVLALDILEPEPPQHCKPVLDIMAQSSRSSSWWAQTRDLRTLLRKFHGSKATDERDKIYALLGMSLNPLDAKAIAIDYRRPSPEVIHEVVMYLLQSTQPDQSDPFTMYDVLDLMCSFTTLDVTYWISAQKVGRRFPLKYNSMTEKPGQIKGKSPVISVIDDPVQLLFEERSTEGLEKQKTCYSQIVELMPDQQSAVASQEYSEGLHILSWGGAGHHVKVVTITNKRNALVEAAGRGCIRVVRQLLRIKLQTRREEETCNAGVLRDAAHLGYTELVRFMLDAGVDVNHRDHSTTSALQNALRMGNEDAVKMLLEAGADANVHGEERPTLLWFAVGGGSKKNVELMLDADPTVYDDAFEYAITNSNEAILKVLVDAGASVNADTLRTAVDGGRGAILKVLLDAGASVDADALQTAVFNNRGGIVKMLLDAGAKVDASVLEFAAYPVTESYGKALLDKGVDVDAYALKRAASPGMEEIRKMLLDAHASTNSPNGEQDSSSAAIN